PTRLAHGLAALGCGPGDHVGLQLYDSVDHVEGMLACFKLRAVPINVNWRYVGEELAHLYSDADLVALIHEQELEPSVADAVARSERPLALVELGPAFEDLLRSASSARD